MKRIITVFILLSSIMFAQSDFEKGFNAYNQENYQDVLLYYKKACDGKIQNGCEEYAKLNQQGY